jgi:hypothetical protein
MPSLPSTLSFTINAANDLVCSKVNQDNFGTTYRGSLATSTEDIVAIVKITHREEGTKTSPKERHVLDVVLTYYPNDGSPSYTAQTYVHFIRRRGSSKIHSERTASGIAQVLNPATTLGIGVMDWGVL